MHRLKSSVHQRAGLTSKPVTFGRARRARTTHARPRVGRRALNVLASLGVIVSLTMAGCSSAPSPASTSLSTVEPSASATAPAVFVPKGSAAQNQPIFDAILQPLARSDGSMPTSAAVVGALTKTGFDPKAMQITPTKTPTNLEADSKVVSVLIRDKCLIGQYIDGFRSIVANPVNGACLVGKTEPIPTN